ncbi:uncharacterized protein LOC127787174 [Diospyros lotus]|uniref:uncharacterized protein LOC127787174 n=1 Tax=Diospyros lotus TaxID=55363 RepID=UPI00224CDEA2|nr:uncharacterized protein LOC127787174 [Diospyros lotus]
MLEHRRDMVGYVHKVVRKKKFKRKTKRRTPDGSVTLQRLYMSCREVFKGPGTIPSPADVQKLCHILDQSCCERASKSRRSNHILLQELLGGQTSIRLYWRCYFPNTQAVIYVIDSSDTDRLAIAKKEFQEILEVSCGAVSCDTDRFGLLIG